MLPKEVTEIRAWTHVLVSCLVFELCRVARYEGCCEEGRDQLPLYGGWDKQWQF